MKVLVASVLFGLLALSLGGDDSDSQGITKAKLEVRRI